MARRSDLRCASCGNPPSGSDADLDLVLGPIWTLDWWCIMAHPNRSTSAVAVGFSTDGRVAHEQRVATVPLPKARA